MQRVLNSSFIRYSLFIKPRDEIMHNQTSGPTHFGSKLNAPLARLLDITSDFLDSELCAHSPGCLAEILFICFVGAIGRLFQRLLKCR